MEKEKLEELNELRKYLEIPINEFKLLLLLALKYKDENGKMIHEEKLYQIVEEALNNIDYQNNILDDDFIIYAKTVKEAFDRALANLGYQKTKKIR